MNVLINVLHGSALAIPVITLITLWYRRRGIEIDHIFLFSAGFIFYLVLPFTLAQSSFFSVYRASSTYGVWEKAFGLVTLETWAWYFISVLLLYCAFILGSWLASREPSQTAPVKNSIDPTALNIFFAGAIFFVTIFGYQLRDYFFWSYQKSTQIPIFGSFVASSILLMSVAVCAIVYRYYRNDTKRSFLKSLLHPAVISYGIVAVLLLSMGGRIIVVTSLMILAVFFSVYIRRLRLLTVAALFVLLVILSHIIVLWRMGFPSEILNPQQYYNIRGLAIALCSENFDVGYSLIHFLGTYSLPLIRFPVVLLSGVIGLIPSFIFPGKTAWILGFPSLGYSIGNLAGGLNVYVSLAINFGILGASVFLFMLSYALQGLKQYASSITTVIYVLVSGWLAAEFFRDFEQTILKEILEFSVLMPFALLVLSRIIVKMKKNSSPNPAV